MARKHWGMHRKAQVELKIFDVDDGPAAVAAALLDIPLLFRFSQERKEQVTLMLSFLAEACASEERFAAALAPSAPRLVFLCSRLYNEMLMEAGMAAERLRSSALLLVCALSRAAKTAETIASSDVGACEGGGSRAGGDCSGSARKAAVVLILSVALADCAPGMETATAAVQAAAISTLASCQVLFAPSGDEATCALLCAALARALASGRTSQRLQIAAMQLLCVILRGGEGYAPASRLLVGGCSKEVAPTPAVAAAFSVLSQCHGGGGALSCTLLRLLLSPQAAAARAYALGTGAVLGSTAAAPLLIHALMPALLAERRPSKQCGECGRIYSRPHAGPSPLEELAAGAVLPGSASLELLIRYLASPHHVAAVRGLELLSLLVRVADRYLFSDMAKSLATSAVAAAATQAATDFDALLCTPPEASKSACMCCEASANSAAFTANSRMNLHAYAKELRQIAVAASLVSVRPAPADVVLALYSAAIQHALPLVRAATALAWRFLVDAAVSRFNYLRTCCSCITASPCCSCYRSVGAHGAGCEGGTCSGVPPIILPTTSSSPPPCETCREVRCLLRALLWLPRQLLGAGYISDAGDGDAVVRRVAGQSLCYLASAIRAVDWQVIDAVFPLSMTQAFGAAPITWLSARLRTEALALNVAAEATVAAEIALTENGSMNLVCDAAAGKDVELLLPPALAAATAALIDTLELSARMLASAFDAMAFGGDCAACLPRAAAGNALCSDSLSDDSRGKRQTAAAEPAISAAASSPFDNARSHTAVLWRAAGASELCDDASPACGPQALSILLREPPHGSAADEAASCVTPPDLHSAQPPLPHLSKVALSSSITAAGLAAISRAAVRIIEAPHRTGSRLSLCAFLEALLRGGVPLPHCMVEVAALVNVHSVLSAILSGFTALPPRAPGAACGMRAAHLRPPPRLAFNVDGSPLPVTSGALNATCATEPSPRIEHDAQSAALRPPTGAMVDSNASTDAAPAAAMATGAQRLVENTQSSAATLHDLPPSLKRSRREIESSPFSNDAEDLVAAVVAAASQVDAISSIGRSASASASLLFACDSAAEKMSRPPLPILPPPLSLSEGPVAVATVAPPALEYLPSVVNPERMKRLKAALRAEQAKKNGVGF